MNGPDMTTEKLSLAISDKIPTLYPDTKIYRFVADNNNKHLIQDLSITYGIPFVGTTKTDLDAMVNKVRVLVGAGKLIVHPRCTNLTGCLQNGHWNKARNQFDRSKLYGHYDALAALVYLVRNLDTVTNPIPQLIGIDPHTHWINNNSQRNLTQNQLKFKQAFKPKQH
jgi:hypothetical protein